ncbi:MAG: Calx-beta domain-containing protein, partial [Halobacteriales archaeon]|nr:Calx-beta domain-containing protein [Halobacteriales archaeon]
PRVQEGDTVLIPVRLSQATVESVQVDVAVTGGTAGGADLDFFTSSLTFAPGETEGTIVVDTAFDKDPEVFETVELTLSTPDGVPVATPTVVLTIEDPSGPTVEFQSSAWSVDEGDSIHVGVVLSEVYPEDVVVTIDRSKKTPGSAGPNDFSTSSPLPVDIVISAGRTTSSLIFEGTSDLRSDDGETVVLEIVDGALTGPTDETTITITEPGCSVDFSLALSGESISTTEVYEACHSISADTFSVKDTGDVTFRAGSTIVLEDGFAVQSGGSFVAEIDPTIE